MAKQAASAKKITKPTNVRTKNPVVANEEARVVSSANSTRTTVRTSTAKPEGFGARFNRELTPHALLSEALGTFILALVVIGMITPFAISPTAPALEPLYAGLAYAVLAIIFSGISGSHLNPAVSFGLWTARKFSGFALPFYWIAQFIGGLAAILTLAMLTGKGLGLDLGRFVGDVNWSVFAIELVGTAILLLGFMAARQRLGLSSLGRSLGVGLALFLALLAGNSLYASMNKSVDISKIQAAGDVPRVLRLDGAVLNPAIALGANEKTDSELQGQGSTGSEKQVSRLSLAETFIAPLLGAAIGANLYRILSRRDDR